MALVDFTLSNARRFYSSMGNPLGWRGLSLHLNCNHRCFNAKFGCMKEDAFVFIIKKFSFP